MGLFSFIRRKKPDDSSEFRRELLLKHGRVCDAVIIDTEINDAGVEIANFSYRVHGVDFESSEILTDDQRKDRVKYAPGAGVMVRYDPRNQGNSTLV